MIYKLTDQPNIASQYLAELRHKKWQQNRLLFRNNLKRIGQIIAYEISKQLLYEKKEIPTPLDNCDCMLLQDQIVLATILRAGLPLHEGLLQVFDKAENAYISAFRKHDSEGNFIIDMPYLTCPNLEGKVLIISDPMVASGSSMHVVLERLKKWGKPSSIHIVSVIAASQGISYIQERYPEVKIWVGDIDPYLNAKSYIIPGLGDAGDLAFGEKLQK
jgi:uracil phosphoribosyltransferase